MTHEERYAALRSEPKPNSAALRTALSHAKQQALRDRDDERRAFQEAREADIRAAAPRFTLVLSSAPTLSLSEPSYPITATLTYTSGPASSASTPNNPRSVLFSPSYGPLSASAPNGNLYSVYTTPTCRRESRIPRLRPNASIRPPHEPDGSFTEEMEVATWVEWEEVCLSCCIDSDVRSARFFGGCCG